MILDTFNNEGKGEQEKTESIRIINIEIDKIMEIKCENK